MDTIAKHKYVIQNPETGMYVKLSENIAQVEWVDLISATRFDVVLDEALARVDFPARAVEVVETTTVQPVGSLDLLVDTALESSFSELNSFVAGMNSSDAQDVVYRLEHLAQRAIRIAAYLDARSYDGHDHDKAVKEQNKVIARVRKAMGYSYPKDELHF